MTKQKKVTCKFEFEIQTNLTEAQLKKAIHEHINGIANEPEVVFPYSDKDNDEDAPCPEILSCEITVSKIPK